jgi:hypothetical protein
LVLYRGILIFLKKNPNDAKIFKIMVLRDVMRLKRPLLNIIDVLLNPQF